jgi:D-alanyl-lipoteichoic acid acyltransferase DltB (MBOAT superfamily)
MLILTGLVRKAVIADTCAVLADAAFSGKLGNDGWSTLIGVYAFACQIYGDFSGYSDLARGSAQLLGFQFMVNFRQPYLATSLRDFWRRWHISLSTWLRDYLYIPLGGNQGGEAKTYRNLIITMLLGGLWHGSNWTFVLWGAIQGAGLSIERFIFGHCKNREEPRGWQKWVLRAITFHVVCLAWIFFRAQSLRDAIAMIGQLGHFQWSSSYAAAWLYLGIVGAISLLMDLTVENAGTEYISQGDSAVLRHSVVVVGMVLLLLFAASEAHAFIYFQL